MAAYSLGEWNFCCLVDVFLGTWIQTETALVTLTSLVTLISWVFWVTMTLTFLVTMT